MREKAFFGIRKGTWIHAYALLVSPREIRHHVSRFNNSFGTDNDHQDYIVSGRRGYRMTDDLDEIEEAIDRDLAMASKRLKEIKKRKKNLERLRNEKRYGRIR